MIVVEILAGPDSRFPAILGRVSHTDGTAVRDLK